MEATDVKMSNNCESGVSDGSSTVTSSHSVEVRQYNYICHCIVMFCSRNELVLSSTVPDTLKLTY